MCGGRRRGLRLRRPGRGRSTHLGRHAARTSRVRPVVAALIRARLEPGVRRRIRVLCLLRVMLIAAEPVLL